MIKDISEWQMNYGQPIELIDGDNLQHIKNHYEYICREIDREDILIVSVVG